MAGYASAVTALRVPLRYSRAMALLSTILLMGPAMSGVWIDDREVRVRMGWAFSARFSRSSVLAAGAGGAGDALPAFGWGVHGRRGRWLVNGSYRGLVRLDLAPGCRARVLFLPVQLTTLWVSVVDPDALTSVAGDARS